MGKTYEINKYSRAVIEGLGCEIVLNNNEGSHSIQEVYGIKDKETGKWVYPKQCRIIYGEAEYDRFLDLKGTKTDCYPLNGVEIRLEEYGNTIIKSNGINSFIYYNRYDDDSMTIQIENGSRDDIDLLFKSCKSNKGEPEILIRTFTGNYIAHIFMSWDKWNFNSNKHTIDEFTPDYVVDSIIKAIRLYNHGDLWNKGMEQALNILTPALKLYAVDFLKEWIECLKNRVKASIRKDQKRKMEISKIQNGIAMNQKAISELKDAKNVLIKTVNYIEKGSKRK